ncbi:MAG: hypothetical protein JST23_11055 [Bacteroidetes bacterium]|nr:hypothetical protein [Bacteroidota bacterium]
MKKKHEHVKNLGTDIKSLECLTDDSNKAYDRAYWEYLQNKNAALKKYPQYAKQFAIDYAAEAQ